MGEVRKDKGKRLQVKERGAGESFPMARGMQGKND